MNNRNFESAALAGAALVLALFATEMLALAAVHAALTFFGVIE